MIATTTAALAVFFMSLSALYTEGPIGISSCLELQMIGNELSHPLDGHYVLTQHINCGAGAPEGNDTRFWNENIDEWVDENVWEILIPDTLDGVINNGYFGFEPIYLSGGSFDGAGYTISNLWIFRKTGEDVGLFSVISSSTITNLIIDNASVVGGDGTGVLAGRIDNNSTISHITISDSMARAYIQFHGGMLAGEMSNSVVTNITIDGGFVHGSGNIIGGIIGLISKSTITDSTTSADVDGGYSVGGAFGQVRHSIITNVHATGNVLGEDNEYIGKTDIYNIGGFIGEIIDIDEMDMPTTISNSSSSGGVTVNQVTNNDWYGVYNIGGFIGETEVNSSSYPIIILNSFTAPTAHVVINAKTDVEYIGGFIGYALDIEIENSYAQGNVSVETVGGENYGYVEYIGGFIGGAERIFILHSFATGDVTPQTGGIEDTPIKTRTIGGFIGDVSYGSEIRDSYATGNVFGGSSVGGFVGRADDSEFYNSYATGNVVGNHDKSDEIGGFIGYTDNDEGRVYIYDSYATGNVSGYHEIGGFVGDNNSGHIFRSYATGNVTGTGDNPYRLGGFVGQNDDNSALIEGSYATGNVSGHYQIGGFVGENDNRGSTIRDSYARGSVTGVYEIGGFAGYNKGQLLNVYSIGLVSGNSTTGGLVGRRGANGVVVYSYWDVQTSGQSQSDGGEGKTTAQMKMISTFTSEPGPLYSLQNHEGVASFRYLIWYITDNKGSSDYIQVSELALHLGGNPIEWPEGTVLENINGYSPDDEEVEYLIDGNLNTKWLDEDFDWNGGSVVVIDLGTQVTFDGYIWATGNDYPDRDPSSWQLLGSNDYVAIGDLGVWNEDWTLLDSRENEIVTDDRRVFVNVLGANWDFEDIWDIQVNKNNGYPFFRWTDLDEDELTYPEVSSKPASSVTRTSARLNGFVDLVGTEDIISFGFEYGKTTSYGMSQIIGGGLFDTVPFYVDISNLTCGTPYNYRAIVHTNTETVIGDNVKFTTTACPSSGGGTTFFFATQNNPLTAPLTPPTTAPSTQTPSTGTTGSTTSCPARIDSALKTAGNNTIFYITPQCTKLRVPTPTLYFTYFTSWSTVQTVPQSTIDAVPAEPTGFFPYGPLYTPQYGALVKTPFDPKVYLILNDTKYWITDEIVFNTLGYEWNWIEGVDPRFLDKYPTGSEITNTTRHPHYTIVKYDNSPRVYRLEPGPNNSTVKRWIPDEPTFNRLNFRWDRILTIANTFVYADGEDLTN